MILFIMILINAGLFADGTEPYGSGTEDDPYWISSLDNLLWFCTPRYLPNPVYLMQTANIDASESQNWNDGKGFITIGNYDYPFHVVYDGQGNSISNLFINRPEEQGIGLFGVVEDALIIDLSLIGANVAGEYQVGGLVGHAMATSIMGVFCEDVNISGYERVGGMVGYNDANTVNQYVIELCNVTGNVEGTKKVGGLLGRSVQCSVYNCTTGMDEVIGGQETGGLIGDSYGTTISFCSSLGQVIGGQETGGLVGTANYSTIINYCHSEGSVIGTGGVGGLVGVFGYDDNYLENCGSIAEVVGDGNVGGLVGSNGASINNCYSAGFVDCTSGTRGGLIGYLGGTSGPLSNLFWDMEESGWSWGIGSGQEEGVTGKTTVEMKDVATYTNLETEGLDFPWDFFGNPYDDTGSENIWHIGGSQNNGYPYISDSIITNISELTTLKEVVLLKNNYPNPFSSFTNISFSVELDSKVELIFYNFQGQKIKTLINKQYLKGEHNVIWDGTDENDNTVISGMYFCQLIVNNRTIGIKKCIFLK